LRSIKTSKNYNQETALALYLANQYRVGIDHGLGLTGGHTGHIRVALAVIAVKGDLHLHVLEDGAEWTGLHAVPATCAGGLVNDHIAIFVLGNGLILTGLFALRFGAVLADSGMGFVLLDGNL